ncbi:MAG: hypothetical protein Q9209_004873 [Squamulea sp. 1 TL-2023]
MSSKPKMIIYTGAPLSTTLSWSESHLTAPLQPPFLHNTSSSSHTSALRAVHQHTVSTPPPPQWRSIPIYRNHIPTGLTQATNPDFQPYYPANAEGKASLFHSTTNLSFVTDSAEGDSFASALPRRGEDSKDSEILSQYYEHSFAIHEDVPSSRVLPADSFLSNSSTSQPTSSYASTTEDETNYSITTPPTTQNPLKKLLVTTITDLAQIPTASYLHSIEPQTMTVNILVGIISLPAPRTVVTRKGQRTVSLLELTVGDETKAGFGVNIWLPAPFSYLKPGEVDLREEMEVLRVRDVVLMRNVALTSFRGKVYGQSLRRGMTRVELVHRLDGSGEGDRGLLPTSELGRKERGVMLEKVRRVREWVLEFVGGPHGKRETWRREAGGVHLPADTQ